MKKWKIFQGCNQRILRHRIAVCLHDVSLQVCRVWACVLLSPYLLSSILCIYLLYLLSWLYLFIHLYYRLDFDAKGGKMQARISQRYLLVLFLVLLFFFLHFFFSTLFSRPCPFFLLIYLYLVTEKTEDLINNGSFIAPAINDIYAS